jgi:hypothetical protein
MKTKQHFTQHFDTLQYFTTLYSSHHFPFLVAAAAQPRLITISNFLVAAAATSPSPFSSSQQRLSRGYITIALFLVAAAAQLARGARTFDAQR